MGQRTPVQTYSFASGILAANLIARQDLKRYYDGALEARNLTMQTHGGMKRRGGLRFAVEFPEAATGAKLARFEFSNKQVYLIAFSDAKITVFMDGVKQAERVAPWAAADLDGLDFAQSLDTMLIAHGSYPTQRLERQGSNTAWALSPVAFTNIPTYRFGKPTTNTGTPALTTGSTTFTAGGAEFGADVGKWIIGNQGKAKITAVASATSVSIDIVQDFKTTTAIAAGDWSIEEDVWSAARGWPASVDFYQGRSVWGGSKTLLDKVWASGSGQFFDFKTTWEALVDEALDATLTQGSEVNEVKKVMAMQSLFAFTTGGLFAAGDAALTPNNFLLKKNSAVPAAALAPVELEESVAFIAADETGKATGLHELVVDGAAVTTRYVTENLNVLCPEVMSGPVDIAVRKGGANAASAHHVFVPNADGTVAVLHLRRSQNMLGWTWWDARGPSGSDQVQRVATVGGTAWFLLKRTVGGATKYFIEYLDETAVFDCSIKQTSVTAQSVWNGFAHLEGETLSVWADGALRDDATVVNGQVSITDGGQALGVFAMEAGFAFDWVLETMPPVAQLGDGTLIGAAMRIYKASIRVREAHDMVVNARPVAFRRLGAMKLDAPVGAYTGVKTVAFLGWKRGEDNAATVRMSGRLPITIEAVTAHVAV